MIHHIHVDFTMSSLNEHICPAGFITHSLTHDDTANTINALWAQSILLDIIPETFHQTIVVLPKYDKINIRITHLVKHRFAQTEIRQRRTRFIERKTTVTIFGLNTGQTILQRHG